MMIYGDSLQAFLVTIVVPDEETVTKWAEENNHDASNYDALINGKEFKDHLTAKMREVQKEKNVSIIIS